MKQTLLTLILASSFALSAQTEVRFSAGVKNHPDNFLKVVELPASLDDPYESLPIFQGDLGIRQYFGRSDWFIDGMLTWRHTREVMEVELRSPEIDPYFGFVKEGDKVLYTNMQLRNFVGVKAGSGIRLPLSRRTTNSFIFAIGVQGFVPVASKSVSIMGNERREFPRFQKNEFGYGIYYGAYLKPAFEFNFSRKRSNPWRFTIYAEGDLLFQNKSEVNPKYLYGGGIGVGYQL